MKNCKIIVDISLKLIWIGWYYFILYMVYMAKRNEIIIIIFFFGSIVMIPSIIYREYFKNQLNGKYYTPIVQ